MLTTRAIAENVLLSGVDVDMMTLLLRELDGRAPEQRSGLLRLVGQLGNTGKEALLNWPDAFGTQIQASPCSHWRRRTRPRSQPPTGPSWACR